VSLTSEAPAQADNGQRFAIGLEYSQMAPRGFADTATVIRIHGAHSRTFAGEAGGTHAAMVYQAGIGGGGTSDSVHIIDIAASAAVRGAVAVTSGGSQIYGQAGPSGHITTVGDKRDNPVTMAGVGGRAEAGYAMAYGPDSDRRIQFGFFAEGGLTGVEYGIGIRAASF
jgi:hypothetical protein